MGCVQTKPSTYSPIKGLEHLKSQYGYLKGEKIQHGIVRNQKSSIGDDSGNVVKRQSESGAVDGRGKDLSKASRKIGGDDLVDGWPKWLLDNVEKDALVGLVPKSADSYEKIAKVCDFRVCLVRLLIYE